MNEAIKNYVLKIWLTALLSTLLLFLIAPVITPSAFPIWVYPLSDILGTMIITIFLGMLISIPSVFLLWVCVLFTYDSFTVRIGWFKLVWSVIGAGLCIIPFRLIGKWFIGSDTERWSFCAFYAVVVVAAIWFYELPTAKNE
ncbi:hypothetical protein [Mucilaginibacter myungsuensis]|uniref:Uncharacterized protein n=1 Tax=Mucilaginibacter myungsuensis TaxID=649104 RepID=A0A929L2V6_9SPHI|nr:hypothetical protein [Mucilaginibacter myungsuensis]MBE9662221.1 hypothetical protein [Mucilaginibacter myungsuensis]MDN3599345.1 hypothetical protein [Mucilaginibacter myungsuensis]